ncbi:MAG: tetratricopeptide repeat protein, partial [Planctomycetota bacterium]
CYGLAGVLFDRHDFAGARKHYQRSLDFYAGSTDSRKLVPLHLGLALIDRIENKYARSIEHFKEALSLARETGNLINIARIQGNLANTHRVMGELAIALEYLEESTRTRKLVGDKQGLAVCLNNLSRIQNHRGEFQAALDATEEALSTFQDVGDRKGIAIARCNLGELLLLRGRPLDARTMLEECSLVDRENEGAPLACDILCNLARVELVICEYPRAEELFHKCLSRLPAEQDQGLRVHALAGLAEICLNRGMEEAAEDALREAEEFTVNGAGRENQLHLRGLRMRLCRQRGDLQESIELARNDPDDEAGRYGTANLALELGAAYRDLGPDWADKTEKYLIRAAGEFENMGCPVEAAEALGELSVYWRLTGEEETAAESLRHAEKLLSSGQLKPRLSRFTEVFKARLP